MELLKSGADLTISLENPRYQSEECKFQIIKWPTKKDTKPLIFSTSIFNHSSLLRTSFLEASSTKVETR